MTKIVTRQSQKRKHWQELWFWSRIAIRIKWVGCTIFYSVHTFPHQKSLYSMFIDIIIDQSWTHAISIRRSLYMHSQFTHHFASLDGVSLGAMSIHPYQAKDDSIWRWEKLFTLLRHNEYETKQENQMLPSSTICKHCQAMIGLSLNNKHFGGII